MTTFLRRIWWRYPKLGKGRKKKQKWRKPTGRDNKMREKRKGRPASVSIGYRTNAKVRKENEMNLVFIRNSKGLENVKKGQVVVLAHVGKKNKMEIAKKAKEKGIIIQNLNTKKILDKKKK